LNDVGSDVIETTDGGYLLSGWTSLDATNIDLWLIKTDTEGMLQWDMTFGGIDYEAGFSIDQVLDGGYIATGVTNSYGNGLKDIYVVRLGDKQIIPAPGAFILGSIGLALSGWKLRRRRTI
jgi:hypothetical protein